MRLSSYCVLDYPFYSNKKWITQFNTFSDDFSSILKKVNSIFLLQIYIENLVNIKKILGNIKILLFILHFFFILYLVYEPK